MTYKILIKPFEELQEYQVILDTDNIEYTMDQYQRNRPPFNWEIIETAVAGSADPRQLTLNFEQDGIQ